MGIIKRINSREKSIVERRSKNLRREYFAWRSGAGQCEAPGSVNSAAGNLTPPDAARLPGQVVLRDHRLMSYRTLANWPPIWMRRGRQKSTAGEAVPVRETLRGEIGILKEAFLSTATRPARIYLIVAHEGSEYLGSLLFDDAVFCRQIYPLFQEQRGKTIAEIGGVIGYLG